MNSYINTSINMNWKEAEQQVLHGKKIKLPEWDGYWFCEKGSTEIKVFTGDGKVLDTPYISHNVNRGDWQITNGSRSFGGAIKALKGGCIVQRKGWNGKGMFLKLVNPYLDMKISDEQVENVVNATLLPWIGMKTVDNQFVPWLASQTDMLAEDWYIIENNN